MDRGVELTKFLELVERAATDRDDSAFHSAIQQTKVLFTMSDAEIGAMFTVSRPTATRWASGASAPHPAMRPGIYRKLIRKARQALRELGEAPASRTSSSVGVTDELRVR